MASYSAGEATVNIIPDMEGFPTRLRSDLDAVSVDHSVNIVPNTEGFQERLDAELARSEDSVRVGVDVDTAAANAHITELNARLDELAARSPNVNVDVNDHGSMARTAASADSAGSSVGLLGAAIVSLGPALIPIGAAAVTGIGAIGTLAVAGGAGLGVLVGALHGVSGAVTAVDGAQHKAGETAAQYAAAQTKAQQALDGLTPAGRDFVLFVTGSMEPALKKLQATAAQGLLPGLQAGLQGLLPVMPVINDAVAKLADTMGTLFQKAGNALNSPFWRQFISYVGDEGSKTLNTFGATVGNLAEGFVALLQAFAPLSDQMGNGLLGLSQKFADWAKNLGTNSAFQQFMAYVKENGPKVTQFFGDLATLVGHLITAFAPFGSVMLDALDKVTKFLDKLSPTQLLAVAAGVAALVAVFAPGPGSIAVAIGLAAAALTSFYNNNKGFHDYVDQILNPALKKFADNYNAVGKAADDGAKSTDNASFSWSELGKTLTRDVLPAIGTALGVFVETTKQALIGFGKDLGTIVDFFKFSAQTIEDDFAFLADRWAAFTHAMVTGWNFLGSDVADVEKNLKGGWADLEQAGSFLSDRWDAFTHAMRTGWEFLGSDVQDVSNNLKGFWADLGQALDFLKGDFDSFVNSAGQIWDKMKELTAKPINFVINTILNDGLIKGFNAVTGIIGIPAVPNIPSIPGYASGGALAGPGTGTSDEILMWGSNGEHVLPADEVEKGGGQQNIYKLREVIRAGNLPAFAEGGAVDPNSFTWPQMDAIRQQMFPGSILGSAYRPGSNSTSSTGGDYHSRGMAIDIDEPGNDAGLLARDAAALDAKFGNDITELIHNPNGSIKDGQHEPGSFWGDDWPLHLDHVHWAMTPEALFKATSGTMHGVAQGSITGGIVHELLSATVGKIFDGIMSPIGALVGSFPKPPPVINGIPQAFFNTEKGKVRDFITAKANAKQGSSGGGGTIPVGDHLALIDQALALDNIPKDQWPQWEAGLNTLIDRESTWNAGAINLTDSNAAAGHPSKGLMQEIDSTYAGNRNPNTVDDVFDPLSNIAAGINYINRTYGGIGNVQQANANMGHMGYDTGGIVPPGYSSIYNGTGQNEVMLNPQQVEWVHKGMAEGGGGATYNGVVNHGPVYLTDLDELERRQKQGQRMAAVRAGIR